MALIGTRIAVASVGISCQPAHQIVENVALIGVYAGELLARRHTPFDYLLVGASNAARMIEDKRFFPTDLWGSLVGTKPYWDEYRAHFWHAKVATPGEFASKYGHMVDNWDTMRECRRLIFIVANTQGNVTRMLADREHIDTRLTTDDVVRLWFALVGYFGRFPIPNGQRTVEVHAVTAAGLDGGVRPHPLMIGTRSIRAPITVHKIGPDDTQWRGNSRAWAKVLEQIVAPDTACNTPQRDAKSRP